MNRLLACLMLTGRGLRQYIVVMSVKENHIPLEKISSWTGTFSSKITAILPPKILQIAFVWFS